MFCGILSMVITGGQYKKCGSRRQRPSIYAGETAERAAQSYRAKPSHPQRPIIVAPLRLIRGAHDRSHAPHNASGAGILRRFGPRIVHGAVASLGAGLR